jgi:parvulin-like peptidyl-prolyl isomerase
LAKKKVEKPRREVTKRQLSHWQQQKKRQRITFILGVFIIGVVLVVLGVGWYINEYRPLHQTVIRVNDTEFDMDYYIQRLKFHGADQTIFYLYAVVNNVERAIEQDELIRQAAMKLGISVSDSELEEELEYYNSPVDDNLRDIIRNRLLVGKLKDEYFEHQVPVSAEQVHIMAMFLESRRQAVDVRGRLVAGEDFAELAEELSLESFSQEEKGDLDWHPREVLSILLGTSVPVDYAFGSEAGVLSQPLHDEAKSKDVGYWLVEVLEREEEEERAHARAILLGDEDQAQQVKGRLEAGEDFAALAEELSQHGESNMDGGDLDWFTPDEVSSALGEFAFDPEVELNTLSEPIRDEEVMTEEGYWLVKVIDKNESREIAEDDRDLLNSKALNDWVAGLWDDPENEVTSYMDDAQKRWAADKAYEELE